MACSERPRMGHLSNSLQCRRILWGQRARRVRRFRSRVPEGGTPGGTAGGYISAYPAKQAPCIGNPVELSGARKYILYRTMSARVPRWIPPPREWKETAN